MCIAEVYYILIELEKLVGIGMLENEVFVIDLTLCVSAGEIINNISAALEIPGASNKIINLKFKDTVLSQSQLLSIKSLVESFSSTVGKIETTSKEMHEICTTLGLNASFTGAAQANENKIVIPEFKAGFTPFETPSKAQTLESMVQGNVFAQEVAEDEFYAKKEPELAPEVELAPEPEPKEKELQQEINIEEAIQQTAQVAFENATNLDFMKEIIKEAEVKNNVSRCDSGGGDEPSTISTTRATCGDALAVGEPAASLTEKAMPSGKAAQEQQTVKEEDGQYVGVYTKAPEVEYEEEQINFFGPPTDEPVIIDPKQTIFVNQTLRSGQVLEYDGNVVIIGDCHPGSEIKASGDITVWGVLGSVAHAGSTGSRDAKIRALKMNAVQLRIANCYSRRPDGTNIPYIVKSSTFTPEEARLEDGGIILYKMS